MSDMTTHTSKAEWTTAPDDIWGVDRFYCDGKFTPLIRVVESLNRLSELEERCKVLEDGIKSALVELDSDSYEHAYTELNKLLTNDNGN